MNKALEPDELFDIKKWLKTGSINIFGMELSGKDTQAELLAELFNGAVIGGGDILRNSVIPPSSQAALDNGQYIPTQDYLDIVLPYFKKNDFKNKPLFLSAVGRWLGEEKNVLAATEASDHPIQAVIYIKITKKVALQRLETAVRNRSDDYTEHVIKRIMEFTKKTLPVIEVYRQMGLLIEIDGEQPIDSVTSDILKALHSKTKE